MSDWIPACAGMTTWERKSADEAPHAATPDFVSDAVSELVNIYNSRESGNPDIRKESR